MPVLNIQFYQTFWQAIVWKLRREFNPVFELKSRKFKVLAQHGTTYQVLPSITKLESDVKERKQSFESLQQASEQLAEREKILLTIDPKSCLVRQIEVPNKSIPKLEAILQFELERNTPFSNDKVISGWTVLQNDKIKKKTVVAQAILKKDLLEPIFAALAQRNITIEGIWIDHETAPFAMSANGGRFAESKLQKWLKYFVASIFAIILAGGWLSWTVIKQKSSSMELIDKQLEIHSKTAAVVRKKIATREAISTQFSDVKLKYKNYVPRTETIEQLTTILPDDATLQAINISDQDIKIEGIAAQAGELVSLLEKSPTFKNVKFSSPTIQNPGEVKSRFSLEMEFESKAQD